MINHQIEKSKTTNMEEHGKMKSKQTHHENGKESRIVCHES